MKKIQTIFPKINTRALGKISKITIDYDKSYKSWYVSKRDKNDYQIDDSLWVGSKNEALKLKKELEKEFKIKK